MFRIGDTWEKEVKNQSCAGAPRCKQRGMFAPLLQIPLNSIKENNNPKQFSLSRS